MATHIKVKRKLFANLSIDKTLALSLSAAGVGLSATNLAVNSSRRKEAQLHQTQQLQAMDRLTNSIRGLDFRLKTQPINNPTPTRSEGKKRKSLFNFFRRNGR